MTNHQSSSHARPLVATILIISLAFAAMSCTKPPDSASGANDPSGPTTTLEPKIGGTLVYGIQDESTGWMPSTDRWGPGPINVARAVFDPLVVIGEDGQIHPWLAESFTP